ncbi:hypothetical protein HZB07_02755 [Candidatus Saganbacteria bacterium]|nr:hypothetical protein [Candidatus Saganbacteria bacterium]
MKAKFQSGFIIFVIFWCCSSSILAEEQEAPLTRGDAAMRITAADFVKKKVGELLSWTVGYDLSRVNRANLTPIINYVKAVPKRVPPDGRTVLEITAAVDDPGGLGNIAGVRADLSGIGRLPNTMLVDNGLFGDAKNGDGIYTLQSSVATQTELGPKEIPVAVANKKGWLALAKTSLDIKKNPAIIEAQFVPERARADGQTVITLTARLDNPGRIGDIRSVTLDLRGANIADLLILRNDGREGDMLAGDDLFTVRFTTPPTVPAGNYPVRLNVVNLAGGFAAQDIILKIYK